MGYHRHHGMIVTSWREESIEDAHAKAESLFANTPAHVTPISPPAVNGYRSFAVLPDGSKEGWGESDRADEAREAFKAYLFDMKSKGSWCDWVLVNFPGDERDYLTVRTATGHWSGTLTEYDE